MRPPEDIHLYAILLRVLAVQAALVGVAIAGVCLNRLIGAPLRRRTRERRQHLVVRIREAVFNEGASAALLAAFDSATPSDVAASLGEMEELVRGGEWDRVAGILGKSRAMAEARRGAAARLAVRRIHASRILSAGAAREDEGIIKRLLNDPVPAVRMNALHAVRKIHSPSLIRHVVLSAAVHQGLTDVMYLEILHEVRTPALGVVKDLIREFRDTPPVLLVCLKFLSRVSDPSSHPYLLDLSADPDPAVRVAALRALGQVPLPQTELRLIECLSDEDWVVRAESARSLGRIHAVGAMELLRERLGDMSWWVRLNAAMAIRSMGEAGERVLHRLAESAEGDPRDVAGYVLAIPAIRAESDV